MSGVTGTFTLQFPTFVTRKQSQPCPAFLSSSGSPALVGDSGPANQLNCIYSTQPFDWENNIKEAINTFAIPDKTFAQLNSICRTPTGSEQIIQCKNWSTINRILLPKYCTRNSYFPASENGGCPNYNINFFDPNAPMSHGCSNMVNAQSICSQWVTDNFIAGGLYTSNVDQTMSEYCRQMDTNDCACINADDSIIFSTITKKEVPIPARCWWRPCQASASDEFLIQETGRPPSQCPQEVCIDINNIFADDTDLGKLTINEFSNCGNVSPDKFPWYEQWWFWVIVLTLIIIIFAIIIFYTTGPS